MNLWQLADRPWEMVERVGTIRRDAIRRQRPVNITHRVMCCGRARHDVQALPACRDARWRRKSGRDVVPALLARGEGRTRTGMGWRIAFHSWRALERQKSPNRNCDSLSPPELLPWWGAVTWVILNPSAVRSVTARCRLSIQAIVRSFTVLPEGCSPNRGVAQNAEIVLRS